MFLWIHKKNLLYDVFLWIHNRKFALAGVGVVAVAAVAVLVSSVAVALVFGSFSHTPQTVIRKSLINR